MIMYDMELFRNYNNNKRNYRKRKLTMNLFLIKSNVNNINFLVNFINQL